VSLEALRKQIQAQASPAKAAQALRFFKTGPGDYGEGDRFLGLTMPEVRALLPATDPLAEDELLALLRSPWHEERMLALLALARRFARAKKDEARRRHLVDLYLQNTAFINNWDLVDGSAPQLLGAWLVGRERSVLDRLAASPDLWEQRIAVLATLGLIRAGQHGDTLALCERFLGHPHDLMHKACGWMLREVGKRDLAALRRFLDAHAPAMPRTMLRYAIEKLPERERQGYLRLPRRP